MNANNRPELITSRRNHLESTAMSTYRYPASTFQVTPCDSHGVSAFKVSHFFPIPAQLFLSFHDETSIVLKTESHIL